MSIRTSGASKRLVALLAAVLLVVGLAGPASGGGRNDGGRGAPRLEFVLTLLHNNDGESDLLNAGADLEDFGGIDRFAALVERLRAEATTWPSPGPAIAPPGAAAGRGRGPGGVASGVIMVSSGDNFLAGPEWTASLEKGVPFYDGIGLDLIGYDAIAIGNHEFDFGPDVLADFIESFGSGVPFLSANLDVSGEPRLQALAEAGRITGSTVVEEAGELIGIVGATTPALPAISSPRNVVVLEDVAGEIQAEVDAMTAQGVDKIVLISHLQSIQEELELIPMLDGVDIVVAGGGDELLADPWYPLVPTGEEPVGPYPLFANDSDGTAVPVVTTQGGYRYVGRLVTGFDADGNLLFVDELRSGPVRVAGGAEPDAVEPHPEVRAQVVEPVTAFVADLVANVIAQSEVALDGQRADVRTRETNQGNLIADALLWKAQQLAPEFGAPEPTVALQNGGGIRNDSVVGPGPVTEFDTFSMVPFSNFLTVAEGVTGEVLKALLENAVSNVENVDGRFAQVAGLTFTYDPSAAPGSRVVDVTLADGTPAVVGGVVQPGISVNIATIDFLARGGDEYPFGDTPFTNLGVSYQQALADYIVDGLGGVITAAQYPEGGEGRITALS